MAWETFTDNVAFEQRPVGGSRNAVQVSAEVGSKCTGLALSAPAAVFGGSRQVTELRLCWAESSAPKDVHLLILRTSECVPFMVQGPLPM